MRELRFKEINCHMAHLIGDRGKDQTQVISKPCVLCNLHTYLPKSLIISGSLVYYYKMRKLG